MIKYGRKRRLALATASIMLTAGSYVFAPAAVALPDVQNATGATLSMAMPLVLPMQDPAGDDNPCVQDVTVGGVTKDLGQWLLELGLEQWKNIRNPTPVDPIFVMKCWNYLNKDVTKPEDTPNYEGRLCYPNLPNRSPDYSRPGRYQHGKCVPQSTGNNGGDALTGVPEEFLGEWSGRITQQNPPIPPFSLNVTIEQGPTGSTIASGNYTGTEPCTVHWTLLKAEAAELIVNEVVDSGTCFNNVQVTLTHLGNGSIRYDFEDGNGQGVLSR